MSTVSRKLNKGRQRKHDRSANYLPKHIGEAFQTELHSLIENLAVSEGFKGEYLLSQYKTKYCEEDTTQANVRMWNAVQKWTRTEHRNARTNLRVYLEEPSLSWGDYRSVIATARHIISDVLGPLEQFLPSLGRAVHTNGASTRVRRSVIASALKCTGEPHVTLPALKHWLTAIEGSRIGNHVQVVQASHMFTVPKSSEIDRVACKEPEVNLLLQRSTGIHIRRRLKRFGIDLNDQTVNQDLARSAIFDGLATVDLSSASDSITRQVVCLLLPVEWYVLLDDLRSQYIQVLNEDGTLGDPVYTEMFSSMGNGFTFELESLIFWALTRAVCRELGIRGRISVFGDDIICPSLAVPKLIQLFGFLGFIINPSKSYWTGSFRESCGKHFDGYGDVTPFYLKAPVRCKTDVIRILNHLLLWDGRFFGYFVTPEIYAFHLKWRSTIPQNLWGGTDVSDIGALVTGHSPRCRLVPSTSHVDRPEEGALEHWFMNTNLKEDNIQWNTSRGRRRPAPLRADVGGVQASRLWYLSTVLSELDTFWLKTVNEDGFSVSDEESGRYIIRKVESFASDGSPFFYGDRTSWDPDWFLGCPV